MSNRSVNGTSTAGQYAHITSRYAYSTISSLAKHKPEPNETAYLSKSTIMNRPSNLTRTRSLRLPRLSSRNSHSSNGSKSEDCSLSTSLELEIDPRIAELELKLRASEKKNKDLESESKEMKEQIEFLTNERTILSDSLKESEENLLKERLVWIKALEEVKVWSRKIYDKLKEKCEKIKELEANIAEKEDMLEKLSAKYMRNRKVWEENERKAVEEIKKLDEVFDHVIETLKSLPECQRNCKPIQELLHLLVVETNQSKDQMNGITNGTNVTTNGPIDHKKLTNGHAEQVNGKTEQTIVNTNETNPNNENN